MRNFIQMPDIGFATIRPEGATVYQRAPLFILSVFSCCPAVNRSCADLSRFIGVKTVIWEGNDDTDALCSTSGNCWGSFSARCRRGRVHSCDTSSLENKGSLDCCSCCCSINSIAPWFHFQSFRSYHSFHSDFSFPDLVQYSEIGYNFMVFLLQPSDLY